MHPIQTKTKGNVVLAFGHIFELAKSSSDIMDTVLNAEYLQPNILLTLLRYCEFSVMKRVCVTLTI